jgi:hypothetical protein
MMLRQRLSGHILPSSATMIGVCITAIGLVKLIEGRIGPSHVDEYCAIAALIFLVSAASSYTSLRLEPEVRHVVTLERVADIFFMVGLILLTVVALLFAYEII